MTTKTAELQNENISTGQPKSEYHVEGVGDPADVEIKLDQKLNDYGMAQRLNRSWGNRLRFIEDEKRWVVFCDGRWELVFGAGERAPKGAVAEILDQVVERLSVEAEVRAADASRAAQDRARAEGQTDALIEKAGAKAYHNVMREYINYQEKAHTDAHRSAVLGRQAVHSSSMGKDWDIENHLIGAGNGVVNLRTGELLPYTYDRLALQRITTAYDSAAPNPELFIRTVTELMSEQGEDPNNPTERTIGRVKYQMYQLAYFLTGETCRQKLSIWHGIHGGNGKSLLTSLMQRLLGPVDQGGYYVTVDPSTVLAGPSQAAGGARPDLVKLRGARLAVVRDIRSGGARLDTSLVKSLASGEPVPARGLYDKNLITFDCKAKLVIVCNTIPAYETDGGMTRRIEALHYDRRWDINGDSPDLPPADVDLLDKLTAELPQIFAYLVRLAVKGYAAQWRIEIPPSVKAHSAEANDAMNDVASFLEQCTVKSLFETVPAGKLLGAYNVWAKGMRARTMNKNDFADDLKRMGYEKKITKTGTVYVGIRLIENQYGSYDN
jgi:P4 family phage/plasmid primase-like protien